MSTTQERSKQTKSFVYMASPLFEPGTMEITPAAIVYGKEHERLDGLLFLHTLGHYGCISPETEDQNGCSIEDLTGGAVISVFPTIYGDDALVFRTFTASESEHALTDVHFTTCWGEYHHDWLHSAVIDFSRYVTAAYYAEQVD